MHENELLPIAIEYLQIGSKTTDDIYVKQNGKLVLLLSKNMPITQYAYDSMERLKYTERNVYVASKYYGELIKNDIPSSLRQQHLESTIGYDKIKKESYDVMSNVEKTGKIETTKVEKTSKDLADKVKNVDAALLLQCVNGKNNTVDEYFISHCTNVALLNGLMGKWLNLPDKDIETLTLGGLLHDVGKTKIPSYILNAPRKLTPEEFEIVKMHSQFSYEMLCDNPNVSESVAGIARWHHEKMNGQGYPDGLLGENIPLFARITSVSDVYDALVSKRCYKDAVTPFEVLDMLNESKFSDLDFSLVKVLLDNLPDELVGKTVFLSNGAIGKVKFINKNFLRYPIVDVQGEIISTSPEVYCVMMTV